ncbi:MAG: alpha/beta hydrolase [Planctomycetaceae bacterium]
MRYLLLCLLLTSAVSAAEVGPDPILLWPNGAPGAQGTEDPDKPAIRIYPAPADNNTGAAVLVCPGGGYGVLAYDHEGHQVAKWLNSIGVNAAVLQYRLAPKYHHPSPLNDAQRGLRYLRAHAVKLGIDPHRIGVMGFSAGGHLASTLSTHYDAGQPDAQDEIDRVSCRPDFSILCYPVISLGSDFGHKGSLRNLLGDNPDPELVNSLTNETQVTADTPPTFIFHTAEDPGVKVQNALVYYSALMEKGVKAELHVYQNGPHGVGLAPGDPVLSTWKERLHDWLKTNGFLTSGPRAALSGEVKQNGEPIRWGMIAFYPIRDGKETAESREPVAFAMVSRGKFHIPADRGAPLGPCRVQVVTLGDVQPLPTIENSRELVLVNSGVTVNVVEGKNELQLELPAN